MTQINYSEIADKTIRDFLKAVVLIDDHWSEAQNAPVFEVKDLTQINIEPQTIMPGTVVGDTSTTQVNDNPAPALPIPTDPAYLREIGSEITKHGFLFTGFSYTDAQKETALKLASKSDILILDWHLGAVDSRPALLLLDELKSTGAPRFIFILTDQELGGVRKTIIDHLGEPSEGAGFIFSCGPFSFSLKNKPQAGGSNCVIPGQVLDEAIAGIRMRFGGLLQLAALELLGQYRNCLHEVLDHFHSDTDLPFILEWLENDSPISDSHSFNALAIDEWTSRVTRRFPPSDSRTITNLTVSALLADWKENTTLPSDHMDKIRSAINLEDPSFSGDQSKVTELLGSLDEWMATANCKWPVSLKGQIRGKEWSKNSKRNLAMNYLGLRKGVSSPVETLTKLDVLFQCQADLPLRLNQGTVLIDPSGTYLICITPTCDCSRPKTRIQNRYVFLEAQQVDIPTLKDHPESAVVAIRTKSDGNILLAVTLKPTFTYKIAEPSLEHDLHAAVTYGEDSTFILKPVAQLRPARVQSLISLAAGKAIEVGLDRSELLRQLCKSSGSD